MPVATRSAPESKNRPNGTSAAKLLATVLLLLLPAACGEGRSGDTTGIPQDSAREGRLSVHVTPPTQACTPGQHNLGLASGRDGLLFISERAASNPAAPLVVLLHGAGGNARGTIGIMREQAEREGFVLLVPESRDRTWDIIVGGYGPDIEFLNRAMQEAISRCAINSKKLAIGGFSDGASYALSVGLTNGDLFTEIMAFSPGFSAPGERRGKPRVFVSHGTADRVLPIERCSRPIVRSLQGDGYDVRYREFEGGHEVPREMVDDAVRLLMSAPQ